MCLSTTLGNVEYGVVLIEVLNDSPHQLRLDVDLIVQLAPQLVSIHQKTIRILIILYLVFGFHEIHYVALVRFDQASEIRFGFFVHFVSFSFAYFWLFSIKILNNFFIER